MLAFGAGVPHLVVDSAKREDQDHQVLRGPRTAVEAETCHPRCRCGTVAWLMHVVPNLGYCFDFVGINFVVFDRSSFLLLWGSGIVFSLLEYAIISTTFRPSFRSP
jgi:hypothetical protein